MRRVLLGVGTVATVCGAALLLTPLSVPYSPPIVPTLGVVAAAGILLGAPVLGRQLGIRRGGEPLPDPGTRDGRAVPGDGFDADLAAVSARGDDDRRERIRDRLETATVAALTDASGCSAADAREALAEGSWTDDPDAAAFFAPHVAPSRSLREQLRAFVAGDLPFVRRAKRVVAAIEALER